MKKIMIFLLVAIMLVTLSGCDMDNEPAKDNYAVNDIEQLRAHANENGYATFVDYMETKMNDTERNEIIELLEGHGINQGMKTLRYTSVSGDQNYCYVNGIYTIPYNVRYIVVWSTNIEVDQYNENFNCNRHYAVSDSSQNAYIIIKNENADYRLIYIIPDNEPAAETAMVDYTRTGFDNLLTFLGNQKRNALAELAREHVITDELLNDLRAGESNYIMLYEYAQYLPESDREEVNSMFEEGIINDGLETIAINDSSSGYYYEYKNGVYSISADCKWGVKWAQNIAMDSGHTAFGGVRKFSIADRKNEAFLLYLTEDGHLLVHFTVNKS